MAVVWALHVCSSVSAFGFGPPGRSGAYFNGSAKYEHKYDDGYASHDFTSEFQALLELQQMGLLRFNA